MHATPARWGSDVRAVVPDADPGTVTSVGRDLLARWAEPHRRYHDTTHLAEVLTAVDLLARAERLAPRQRSVALLAAWFHDAVYGVVEADGNERLSAALAARRLTELGASEAFADDVVTAVLDTVDHDLDTGPEPPSPAQVVLHDADLWVLSAPTPRFDEYCRQVREEYREVPAAAYASGRSAVLRPFLVREHVYRSDHARQAWEPAARENIARELTRLAG